MDIVAGDRIILELSTFEDRFLGEVSRVSDDGRLFVRTVLPDLAVQRLKLHAVACVRYVYDGHLIGFRTSVISLSGGNGNTLELKPSGNSFDAEDRCEPRCSCCLPAVVSEGKRSAQAVVEDLSASCVRIRYLNGGLTDFPEKLQRPVRLIFDELGGGGCCALNCRVVKAFMKENARFAVLKFEHDEPDVLEHVAGFMEAHVCCAIPRLQ